MDPCSGSVAEERVRIDTLLQKAVDNWAELIVQVGRPAMFSSAGAMVSHGRELTDEDASQLFRALAPERNQEERKEEGETVFHFTYGDAAHFRVTAHQDRGHLLIMCKPFPFQPPVFALERRGMQDWIDSAKSGICLLIGPPNCGKSSTLARLVQMLAENPGSKVCNFAPDYPALKVSAGAGLLVQRQLGWDVEDLSLGVSLAMCSGFNVVGMEVCSEPADIDTLLRAAMSGMRVVATMQVETVEQARFMLVNTAEGGVSEKIVRSLPGIILKTKMDRGKIEIPVDDTLF